MTRAPAATTRTEELIGSPGLFFGLVYLYSWTFWIPAAISGQEWTRFPALLLFILGGIGPSLVGIVLTYVTENADGRRGFWRRAIDPGRIGAAWYALILLVPVATVLLAILIARASGERLADVADLPSLALLGAIPFNLAAALFEEFGWRGYALDRLQRTSTAFAAALTTGVFWSASHFPLYFIDGTFHNEHGFGSSEFWLFSTSIVPESVLFAWFFNNTRRSILSAILFHWAWNVTGEALSPEGAALVARVFLTGGLAAVVVLAFGHRTLVRRPGRPRP